MQAPITAITTVKEVLVRGKVATGAVLQALRILQLAAAIRAVEPATAKVDVVEVDSEVVAAVVEAKIEVDVADVAADEATSRTRPMVLPTTSRLSLSLLNRSLLRLAATAEA
jgi:hypothetical protein